VDGPSDVNEDCLFVGGGTSERRRRRTRTEDLDIERAELLGTTLPVDPRVIGIPDRPEQGSGAVPEYLL